MNSIERVRAAVELRKPDRVPVDLHNFQPAAKAMGTPLSTVFQDGELLMKKELHGGHTCLGKRMVKNCGII